MPTRKKRLWACPKCGHRFVTRNMWHSCSRHRMGDHFKGKDPIVRRLFDRLHTVIRRIGPVTVYAQKTCIVFQTRARFVGVATRKDWIDIGLWLKRRVEAPRFWWIESPTPHDHVHHVRLTKLRDIDRKLMALIREAYEVGCQRHGKSYQGDR